MGSTDRAEGVVKMVNQKKGFGFIRREGKKDLFFHITECVNKEEFPLMREGSNVRYSSGEGKRGEEGRAVELLQE